MVCRINELEWLAAEIAFRHGGALSMLIAEIGSMLVLAFALGAAVTNDASGRTAHARTAP
jgi:hypothetical protein